MEPIMPSPVLTKADFVRRYSLGEFGNRAPTWDSVEEFLQSGYEGLVHIRNRRAGAPTWYSIPARRVSATVRYLVEEGSLPDGYYLSAMAPHERNVLQGEVRRSVRHLDLHYSTLRHVPMRQALAMTPKNAYGASASAILRSALDPSSYDWLEYLLDSYPDHTIEIGVFSVFWGTIPRRNTIIWEARAY